MYISLKERPQYALKFELQKDKISCWQTLARTRYKPSLPNDHPRSLTLILKEFPLLFKSFFFFFFK